MYFKKLFFFACGGCLLGGPFLSSDLGAAFFSVNFFEALMSKSLQGLFSLDKVGGLFFLMVSSVVCMVSLFSEYYLEHYNNSKFMQVKVLFFFSMIALISAGGVVNLMVGWDLLGLSSLFLIMFYPNKLTSYNSYLTMMFNRAGDLVLMSVLCVMLASSNDFFFFLGSELEMVVVLLSVCSLTKSAQFPLSSWLPAAMAAPTPISAMVHSSTLVTAGLFLISKICLYVLLSSFLFTLVFLSLLSFMLGGLMAKNEPDFKKMVAFSTMSQISMIMLFLLSGFLSLGLCHMFFHAFFKTLLFCCCGASFVMSLSDQMFKKTSLKGCCFQWGLVLSLFSMSGLTFSSSFFSKDKAIEESLCDSPSFLFMCLLLGGILTLMYCVKIMNLIKLNFTSNLLHIKKNGFLFFTVFSSASLFLGILYSYLIPLTDLPICGQLEVFSLLLIMLLPLAWENYSKIPSTLAYLNLDLYFLKSVTFSFLGFFWKTSSLFKNGYSDSFLFKPFATSPPISPNMMDLGGAFSGYIFYFLAFLVLSLGFF